MRISRHLTFVPAGTFGSTLNSDGSPSIDAASTIPFDSIPISLAGSRFATMTIFRPTTSPGVYFVAMPATIVRSSSPVKIVILISFFDFGTRSGMVLEGLIIPFMISQYGWRTTFAVVGFAALLWLIPWLAITPRQMRVPRPEPAQERIPLSWPAFVTLVGNRNLIGICLGFFCFDYYWYVLVNWLPDYMFNVRHLTLQWAGIYTALPLLIFGLGQPIGGWVADRLVRAGWDETRVRKGIVSLAFLSGLLLIPAVQAQSPKVALVLIMSGCLVGFSTANQLVILQNCAPAVQIGLWVGIFNFIGNLAGILAAKLTGFLIAQTNSYSPPFILAAIIIAVGQLSFWLVVGPLRKQTEGAVTS